MKFLYRLGYYLGGFSVGLIFLAFILNGKKTSCNYTPNARVIDNLIQKKIIIPEAILKDKPQLDSNQIREIIKRGNVDFSKSDTKRDSCKMYHIENADTDDAFLELTNCAKTVTLISVSGI